MPHAPRRRRASSRPSSATPTPVPPATRPAADPPDLGHGDARGDGDRVEEAAVRSNPELVTTGRSGGTSRTADTSRLAGYVADQERTSAVPPGAAIPKSPENFAGPETESKTPPRKRSGAPTPKPVPPSPPEPSGGDPKSPVRPPPPTPPPAPKPAPDPKPPVVETDRPLRLRKPEPR
ncbi:MAG: hypothetical protein U1E39_18305 [Planctomycetota bacterium]